MREIRTFELDHTDQTTGIFIDRPHTLRVCRGMLWITIAGETADLWLSAGESIFGRPIRKAISTARRCSTPFANIMTGNLVESHS